MSFLFNPYDIMLWERHSKNVCKHKGMERETLSISLYLHVELVAGLSINRKTIPYKKRRYIHYTSSTKAYKLSTTRKSMSAIAELTNKKFTYS